MTVFISTELFDGNKKKRAKIIEINELPLINLTYFGSLLIPTHPPFAKHHRQHQQQQRNSISAQLFLSSLKIEI